MIATLLCDVTFPGNCSSPKIGLAAFVAALLTDSRERLCNLSKLPRTQCHRLGLAP